jgi:hypothetical protein
MVTTHTELERLGAPLLILYLGMHIQMGYTGFIYLIVDKTDVGFCQVAANGTGPSPP